MTVPGHQSLPEPAGGFVSFDGEPYYRISGYDRMPSFLMAVASDTDIWMYVTSTGGLTAGRVDPDGCLFPYETADKLEDAHHHTGPVSLLRVRQRGSTARVAGGRDALVDVARAPEVDAVLAAIVGAAGLVPTLAAAEAGKRLMLANKEAIVSAGALLMAAVRRGGAELLPVDSEHNAIHQCLAGVRAAERDGGDGQDRTVPGRDGRQLDRERSDDRLRGHPPREERRGHGRQEFRGHRYPR